MFLSLHSIDSTTVSELYRIVSQRLEIFTTRSLNEQQHKILIEKRKRYASKSLHSGLLALDIPISSTQDDYHPSLLPSTNDETIGGSTLKCGFVLRLVNQAGSCCSVCKHWLKARMKQSNDDKGNGVGTFVGNPDISTFIYLLASYVYPFIHSLMLSL